MEKTYMNNIAIINKNKKMKNKKNLIHELQKKEIQSD